MLTAVAAGPDGLPAPTEELLGRLDECLRELHTVLRDLDARAEDRRGRGMPAEESVLGWLADTTRQATRQLAGQQQSLLGFAARASNEQLAGVEPVLRYGIATLAHVRGTLATSYPSAYVPVSGNAAAIERVERRILDVFGLAPEQYAVTATTSGAAAYSLVEAFLVRTRLRQGDTVLLAPDVDNDVALQLATLPSVRVVRAGGRGTGDLIDAVRRYRPRCVFADPLATTAAQRMVDLSDLLDALYPVVAARTTVVIDGTAVSGALPAQLPPADEKVEVLYYERGPALQLGMDAGLAGVVAHPAALRDWFTRQRHNAGLVPSRTAVDLFPRYDRDLYLWRRGLAGANALRLATLLDVDPRVRAVGRVWHPGLADHPDTAIADRLRSAGNRVTFVWHEQRHAEFDGVIQRVVARTGGTPELSTVDGSPAFLRLSVGDRGDQVDILAEACAAALAETDVPV